MLCSLFDNDGIEAVLPAEYDRCLVDFSQVLFDSCDEFCLRVDSDSTQKRIGHLAEKGLDQVQPGAVRWRKDELEPVGNTCKIPAGLLRYVRRMVVQHNPYYHLFRILGVDQLQKLDKLHTPMAGPDQPVHVSGQQVDSCKEAHRSVSLVFVVAKYRGMLAGHGRQILASVGNCLNARLLIIGKKCHHIRSFMIFAACQFHLFVYEEHLGHFRLKLRVPSLNVIGYLVRANLALPEYLGNRSSRQARKRRMPPVHAMLPYMLRQELSRPQLIGITKVLRLLTGQRYDPRPRLRRDGGRSTTARYVGKSRERPQPKRLINTPLHFRAVGAKAPSYRRNGFASSVSKQDLSPLHTGRGLCSRVAHSLKPVSNIALQQQHRSLSPKRHSTYPPPAVTVEDSIPLSQPKYNVN